MAADPEELGLEITQIFTDATPTMTKPVQRTVLIGEHFQVEEELVLGEYSGSSVTLPYPDLETGALVEGATYPINLQDEVVVSLTDSRYGQFTLTGGGTDYTANASDVSLLSSINRVVS